MEGISFWAIFASLILLIHSSSSADDALKQSLTYFFQRLSDGHHPNDPNFGWNTTSDPCIDKWKGVTCGNYSNVRIVALEGLGLNGTFDANSICRVQSLSVLSIQNNSIYGEVPPDISRCKRLTHLYINDNQLSGSLPSTLSLLRNLKRLFISNNLFAGELPDLPKISGLMSFLAQNNRLSGEIPQFDFTNLDKFNVSFNNFSGPVPDLNGKFDASSLYGNSGLCGKPLPNACPPTPPRAPPRTSKSQSRKIERILMFVGYFLLGLVFIIFIIYRLIIRKKTLKKNTHVEMTEITEKKSKSSSDSSGYKNGERRSDYSMASSNGSSMLSSPLIVLKNPVIRELHFENLLKAPAELLGRGRYGSLYKVIYEETIILAVKRIKEWSISSEDFRRRMEKIDKLNHPNVLPPLAFYCSKQEKLVVYEYQKNGSLFKLLHGSQSGQEFDWGSRLSIAASLAEGLAFMHKELSEDGIAHGNLKSTNILLNKSKDPCISEYGLMVIDNEHLLSIGSSNDYKAMDLSQSYAKSPFKADVYNFGVILLELLTGKLVQNNGFDLAGWVHSVVREEWTVEVFDKALIKEGVSEERMVNLLQVALKCINPSLEARPTMNQVLNLIISIKEEEERSTDSET